MTFAPITTGVVSVHVPGRARYRALEKKHTHRRRASRGAEGGGRRFTIRGVDSNPAGTCFDARAAVRVSSAAAFAGRRGNRTTLTPGFFGDGSRGGSYSRVAGARVSGLRNLGIQGSGSSRRFEVRSVPEPEEYLRALEEAEREVAAASELIHKAREEGIKRIEDAASEIEDIAEELTHPGLEYHGQTYPPQEHEHVHSAPDQSDLR